jgi:hypothetical protein
MSATNEATLGRLVGLLHEAHDAGYSKGYHDGQVDAGDQRAMDRATVDQWSDTIAEQKVREIIEAIRTDNPTQETAQ